ncbi:PLP-dependent aminotransferase family protein [Serpentinicella alkaliphila]|uniref:GntR family transcriptional regulator n=1 Tax=Serpentinicella alkaliphila TaxID=1734049 RepID=A0A4V2T1Y0_9FIRM|nr:PLP-dependent aminotransferase family protein [Serpentinicella alkaliphila]QUH25850.1 PLP-dependent aminotransferase family protein [Serpentinicella alkaliphila]TCP95303.1 GntR family transcriptional regulator [Serpentinicella alkaliphila]
MPVNSFENYPMTWRPSKTQLKSPLYMSIANLLEYDIVNGYLAPNTKLPPQRELADYLDINLSTITRAFKICELKGLIYAQTGKGTFVSPNFGLEISIVDSTIENQNYIDMGLIKPFDDFNLVTAEAIKKLSDKGCLENLLNYSYPIGSPYHKMTAMKWLKNFNLSVKADNVAITSGSQNSVTLTLISLFGAGDKIAVDMYTYPNFIELANMLNIKLIPIKGDAFGMNPEDLDVQCKLNSIQGIYLTPSCNNPSAILMNMQRKEEIARIIKKNKLILIEDDIFSFIAPRHYLPISYFVPEQSIYICSVSKSLCSGIRVAFLYFADKFSANIIRGIHTTTIKTPALNVEVVAELINTGLAEKIVSDKLIIAKERNEIYKKYFKINNENENPLSFYRWLPLDQKYDANEFEKLALKHGIRIYHSNRFLVANLEEKQFLRVSLSSCLDSNELEKGLKILKDILYDTTYYKNNNSLII